MLKTNEEYYKTKIEKDKEDSVKEVEDTNEDEMEDEKEGKNLVKGINLTALTTQCQNEYLLAWKHQSPKKEEWRVRLKLYNNQKRDKEMVGDTTMFSIFQTVIASLYNDRLMVDFKGREDGDEETADNLSAMAKADYDDMEKDQLDFEWLWDTGFFGRGLMLMEEFERDPDNNVFYPLPEVLDPITFLRDPAATSVNGNRAGKGAMRFGGNETKMTRQEIKDHPWMFEDIRFDKLKYGSGTYSLLQDAVEARTDAQGNQSVNKDKEADLGVNAQYTVTQWFTHCEVDGEIKKVKVWLANDRDTIIGIKVLNRSYWPIIDRPLYPTAHDWDGTSIPDLTEDKQRARAIAQNLGLKAMKADLYPMYIYDTNKIKNKNELNFDFNKFVGIDAKEGEPVLNSVAPMNKARPNMQLLDFIYNSLDISAQKATATPDLKMGIQSKGNETLGEINIATSAADTRYSLGAKVFSWSEKRFWMQWYNMYKDNFAEDIDEKVLRVVGAFGAKWRPLTSKDIICNKDPDIYIESKAVNRAKDLEDRTLLTNYFTMALADPTVNRRWAMKKLARVNGMQKDEIDRLWPPTVDERIAEQQNELLNKNQTVPVLPEDDHTTHLEIHSTAKETEATMAHIKTHIKALSIKKTNPELFPQTDLTALNTMGGGGQQNNTTGGMQTTPSAITPSQTSGQA